MDPKSWWVRSIRTFCHPAAICFYVLVSLIAICQVLPQREGQVQEVSQIIQDIVLPRVQWTPAWLGLWNIQKPTGQFNARFPKAEEIVKEANTILPLVNELKLSKFFRIFKVDLDKECPFWAREDLCKSPSGACHVCECPEEEVPEEFKQHPEQFYVDRHFYDKEEISPWTEPMRADGASKFLPVLDGTDLGGKPSYVDLSLNPPGFTAYRGRNIWELIYKENCIRDDPVDGVELESFSSSSECTEENTFELVLSGLQTAIVVSSAEYNAPSNLPLPFTAPSPIGRGSRHKYNLNLFRWRVAPYRKWIENLYIDFSLLMRTFVKLSGVIENCPCNTGDEKDDSEARSKLQALLALAKKMPSSTQSRLNKPLFVQKQRLALERFTNISRIFDCVECEKCRLHGKVKLAALQVALKANGVEKTPVLSLERNELTALINAIGYFADAIDIVEKFDRRVFAMRQITITGLILIVSIGAHWLGWTRIIHNLITRIGQRTRKEKTDDVSELFVEPTNIVKRASPRKVKRRGT